ncbi:MULTISPECIES: cytochrome c [unclassified Thioalkalivibrio]|uniref:cytochrome c n=1 Tax=unclassified Thioalkalivibrio TaxID=2621013 RepID=UPI00037E33A0|nr:MULTISPECIES: cytochrome c [unclassified Thioalkalivibrio]
MKRMPSTRRSLTAGLSLALLLAAAGTAGAEDEISVPMPGPWGNDFAETLDDPAGVDATEAFKRFRQQSMQATSATYRSIEQILRYDAPFAERLPELADELARGAADIDTWFARETPAPDGEPGALPAVWEAPEFADYKAAYREATTELQRKVEAADDLEDEGFQLRATEALNGVRHQCLACHDNFRRR